MVLGLTGGIGSGKSTVASLFRNLGAEIVDADALVHSILDRPSVRKKLVSTWGKEIENRGTILRPILARIAFQSEDSVRKLNEIIHPIVRKEVGKTIRGSKSRLIVLDAPLLLEVVRQAAPDVGAVRVGVSQGDEVVSRLVIAILLHPEARLLRSNEGQISAIRAVEACG